MIRSHSGGCACGAIRYSLASDPVDAGWCHCRICQRNSGAPAMVFASVPREDFAFTKGGDRVGLFRSSDYGHRLFCRDCGTPLGMEVTYEPKTIDFSVATLDDLATVAPGDSLPRHARSRPEAEAPDGTP